MLIKITASHCSVDWLINQVYVSAIKWNIQDTIWACGRTERLDSTYKAESCESSPTKQHKLDPWQIKQGTLAHTFLWNDTGRVDSRSHMWDRLQQSLLLLQKLCNVNFTGWQSTFNLPLPKNSAASRYHSFYFTVILTASHVCSCIISVTFLLTVHAPSWLFFSTTASFRFPVKEGHSHLVFRGGEEGGTTA